MRKWQVTIKDDLREIKLKAENTEAAIELYRVLKKKYQGQNKLITLRSNHE